MGPTQEGLETRRRVKTMLDGGFKIREIAKAVDISTQRVYQIKRILEAIEEDERQQSEASA